ncbi:MAG: putative DsbA family dithiol-disulfide isomerase [Myxococcota bacterium]|jgi:predicted DsbA family dithiol-disulfide isomerase
MVPITFYADFVCPFSYVAWCSLVPEVSEELTLDVVWQPYQLDPEAPAAGREIAAHEAGRIWGSTRRLAHRFDLPINRQAPLRTPNSRPALAAAEACRVAGTLDSFRKAAFRAWFVDGRDISDLTVLAELAPGIDLSDPRWHVAIDTARSTAQRHGISSVPAFRCSTAVLHGIRDADALLDFIEAATTNSP